MYTLINYNEPDNCSAKLHEHVKALRDEALEEFHYAIRNALRDLDHNLRHSYATLWNVLESGSVESAEKILHTVLD